MLRTVPYPTTSLKEPRRAPTGHRMTLSTSCHDRPPSLPGSPFFAGLIFVLERDGRPRHPTHEVSPSPCQDETAAAPLEPVRPGV